MSTLFPSGSIALAISLTVAGAASAQTTHDVPGTYATIQAAITAAAPGDTVLVQPGSYYEHDIRFLGKDLVVESTGGPEVTIVNAAFWGRGFVFDHAEGPGAVLRGFTIENGRAPNGAWVPFGLPGLPGEHGGGILIDSASPRIELCHFRWNEAGSGSKGGQGQTGQDGSLGSEDGETGQPGNPGGVGGRGGALFIRNGAPLIEACTFRSNVAGRGGQGGKGGTGGEGHFLFWYTGDGGDGGPGGLGARGGDGGAIATELAFATIRSCLFFDNHSGQPGLGGDGGDGGDGDNDGNPGPVGPVETQGWGGGLALFDSNDEVNGCTLVSNSGALGAGSFLQGGVLYNSILWSNSPDQLSATGPVLSCDVQGGFVGAGNLDLDPLFFDPALGDCRLTPGSPCINAGDELLGTPAPMDYLGSPRIVGARLDMGAHEYPTILLGTGEDFILATFLNGQGTGDVGHKIALPGDLLTVQFDSPGMTFTWSKALFAMQAYATGTTLPPSPALPDVYINGSFPGLIVFDLGTGPLGAPLLPPGGVTYGFQVPPGLLGTTVRIQAFVISPLAANGIYATTSVHELELH
ncbi:MAG: hypothetical protein H8D72_01745 [Planctomycetes bacterium]|nr:hypothetical protein [Planctomycetota bacterium]